MVTKIIGAAMATPAAPAPTALVYRMCVVSRGVGSVKLGRGQLEFRGGTEKKLNLSSIKPHVIYVYF